ncbi:hypothetical protein Tco_1500765 [Tanacetum coccineum]
MKSIREEANQIFHMSQQVIPAAQLVPRYHTIGRRNNYAVLQESIQYHQSSSFKELLILMVMLEDPRAMRRSWTGRVKGTESTQTKSRSLDTSERESDGRIGVMTHRGLGSETLGKN